MKRELKLPNRTEPCMQCTVFGERSRLHPLHIHTGGGGDIVKKTHQKKDERLSAACIEYRNSPMRGSNPQPSDRKLCKSLTLYRLS